MPVKWTPETHEVLLVAIMTSGLVSAWSGPNAVKIIEAWPKNKGPAPTVGALTQHLDGLRRKCGSTKGTTSNSAAPKPTPSKASASKSSARKASKATTPVPSSSDDEEDDEEMLKPKTSPTPAPHRRNATLPRATLSPSTGLAERSRKRARDNSPLVDIKVETFLDVDSGDDETGPDPYAELPMAKRQAVMREDSRKKLHAHSRPATVEDVEDEGY